jgi:hypothetical protein
LDALAHEIELSDHLDPESINISLVENFLESLQIDESYRIFRQRVQEIQEKKKQKNVPLF